MKDQLRIPGENILQENFFIVISSCEILALARVCAIIHLSICMPTRWLAGNSHKLEKYDWSVRSMRKIVDILEESLEELKEDGSKIMNEKFMMGFFDDIKNTIPPFKDYYRHMYEHKGIKLISPRDTKVIPLVMLKERLFSTEIEINKQIVDITSTLGSIAATVLLKEIRDPRKATSYHLSSIDGKFSWGKTTSDEHTDGFGKIAVNDPAESSFGATTRELQCFGRISLGNAGGVSQVKLNGDTRRKKIKER